MGPSQFALWLDTAWAGFDLGILSAAQRLRSTGWDAVLSPLSRFLDLLGSGGIGFILLGLALLIWKRTRRWGAAVLLALALGALLTNVLLKPLVARPRPYADPAGPIYAWWRSAGGDLEKDLSFPSGHATAAMAAMTAIFRFAPRRWGAAALLLAGAMAFSRLYLMVHYPTDVLAGLLAGGLAGLLAAWIVRRWPPRSKPGGAPQAPPR